MIKEQEYFLKILRDYIHQNNTENYPDIDWPTIFEYARSHDVLPTVHYQCKSFNNDCQTTYVRQISRYVNMKNELRELEKLLGNVPYVLEKGIVVAELYPIPALRTMGDIDILIPGRYLSLAQQQLLQNGYRSLTDSGDERKFQKKNNLLEIHTRPMHDWPGDEKFVAYFNDFEQHTTYHELEINYHTLFLFVHLRQHLLGSGVGFRQFLDIAVITDKVKLDWDWILSEAEKLDIDDFAKKVLILNERWFAVKSPVKFAMDDDFFEKATKSIFANGVFGRDNLDNKSNPVTKLAVSKGVNAKSAKLLYYLGLVFPSYGTFTKRHDCPDFLPGRKWLLPVAWIHRLFKKGFNKGTRQRVAENVERTSAGSDDRIEYFRQWGL